VEAGLVLDQGVLDAEVGLLEVAPSLARPPPVGDTGRRGVLEGGVMEQVGGVVLGRLGPETERLGRRWRRERRGRLGGDRVRGDPCHEEEAQAQAHAEEDAGEARGAIPRVLMQALGWFYVHSWTVYDATPGPGRLPRVA